MADGNLVTVASKKLKALQEGLLTDVVFLVGENDETAEEIRAVKFDLTVSSTFFANLFNCPLTLKCDGKFRLKNIEPRVFKLIVEFTHLSGQLVSDVDSLETCLKLASAAKEYLIDDLAALCSKLLEDKFLAVDNVWAVLGKHHLVESIASSCLQLLRSETSECLKHRSFLDASEEAIKLFLTLEKMDITSESELLDACLRYASSKEDQRDVFRRCCLRDLRILALDSVDLARVADFLTPEEKVGIVSCTSPLTKMIGAAPQLSPGLCPISEERSEKIVIVGEQTLTLIPDCHILSPKEIYLKMAADSDLYFEHFFDAQKPSFSYDTYTLTLQPKTSMKILSIQIFNDLYFHNEAFGGAQRDTRDDSQFARRLFGIRCYVRSPGGVELNQEVEEDAFFATECGSSTSVKLSTLVPAGATFVCMVRLKGTARLRRLRFSEDILKSINKEATMKAFYHVKHGECHVTVGLIKYGEKHTYGDKTRCIFKSVRFADKDYEIQK
ncbi:uncharacterized protein LOC135936523 [Cloeon dipterum]|uniref:uncharacterized protein LOC135936523 n=1 Tax=Cloeon dipterum TaxID=197152 RepID=UPI0032205316